ncbi:hypothetical protein TELCIR_13046, partial [Teladorsagia circumcincta]
MPQLHLHFSLFTHHYLKLFCCASLVWSKLECDPTSSAKKPDPNNPESYLYCNLEGTFSKRKCLQGKIFNVETGACESAVKSDMANDDPFSQPFYQAPDDLCGSGIPLTILSAPVVCNPSISSCPDGYVCRMYERTGTSYCCQGSSPPVDKASCSHGQVAYYEVLAQMVRHPYLPHLPVLEHIHAPLDTAVGKENAVHHQMSAQPDCLQEEVQRLVVRTIHAEMDMNVLPAVLLNIVVHQEAYRVGAVNAVCALTATNTCPQSHSCMSPVFGPSAVCCPIP